MLKFKNYLDIQNEKILTFIKIKKHLYMNHSYLLLIARIVFSLNYHP